MRKLIVVMVGVGLAAGACVTKVLPKQPQPGDQAGSGSASPPPPGGSTATPRKDPKGEDPCAGGQ